MMDLQKAVEEGRAEEYTITDVALGRNKFLNKVYDWMASGLLFTAAIAYLVSTTFPAIMTWMTAHIGVFILLLLFQVGLASYLTHSGMREQLSQNAAIAIFLGYCGLNGVTLTPLLHMYTTGSITMAFFTTGAIFVTMSIYGHVTKRDLSEPRALFIQALWGIILASLINLFFGSAIIDFIISIVCVVVFTGLIAFDTQLLLDLSKGKEGGGNSALPIVGALILYLDFLNLFIHILKLFGERRE